MPDTEPAKRPAEQRPPTRRPKQQPATGQPERQSANRPEQQSASGLAEEQSTTGLTGQEPATGPRERESANRPPEKQSATGLVGQESATGRPGPESATGLAGQESAMGLREQQSAAGLSEQESATRLAGQQQANVLAGQELEAGLRLQEPAAGRQERESATQLPRHESATGLAKQPANPVAGQPATRAAEEESATGLAGQEYATRLPLVLRTSIGLPVVGVGASACGAAVVTVVLLLSGAPATAGRAGVVLGAAAGGYVIVSAAAGTVWAMWLQRRAVHWLVVHRAPTEAEARHALRLPTDLTVLTGTLWAIGCVLLTVLAAVLVPAWQTADVGLAIALGGVATTAIGFLGGERRVRPVYAAVLQVVPPGSAGSATVRARLVLTWLVASGLPLLAVLLVLALPRLDSAEPTRSLIFLSGIGLVVGAATTVLFARSVTTPLRAMRTALDQVALGRTDVRVPVDDSGEIGLLQRSVNDMVRGLREQERLRDLFGRHVGTDVAANALEHGAQLAGDVRLATALFVDVVDSTALAYRIPPEEFVAKLNRFFAAVVDAVGAHGGLVNKFQGDAALCIFGAPNPLPDAETAALAAAREIRDAVRRTGELDLGIGVATGRVFAGRLGARERLEYTVIGDAVNEAARLTEKAKQVRSRILASDAVIARCTPEERADWARYRSLRLRGRRERTETWTASTNAAT
ncbi:MAG TPA: adenylate/guanylate cyclase domain-containing protein [Pseudonocardiaceae bacterium]